MNQFEQFMFATEELQNNMADEITVKRIQKEICQSEGFEFSKATIRRMIQRAKEIFDEKNIIYPEGY